MTPPSTGSSCRSRFSAKYLRGASSFLSSLDPDLLTSPRGAHKSLSRHWWAWPASLCPRSAQAGSPSRGDDGRRELSVAAPRNKHAAQLVEGVQAQTRRLAGVRCHAQQHRHTSLQRRSRVPGVGPTLHAWPAALLACAALASHPLERQGRARHKKQTGPAMRQHDNRTWKKKSLLEVFFS